LELDSEIIATELKQAEDKLQGQIAQLSQLNILKDQLFLALATQKQQNQAQDLEVRAQIEQLQQNLNTLTSSYFLQKEEKLAQINQIKQKIQSDRITSNIAEIGVSIAQREVQRFQTARQQGIVTEVSLSEKQDTLQQKQQLFEQAKAEIQQAQLRLAEQQISYQRTIHQAEAEITQAKLRLKEKEKNYQSWLNEGKLAILKSEEELKNRKREITALETEIAQNKSQIASLKLQLAQRTIKSPANGVIFELPIERTGAVVQPAQTIAQIAPENSPLILKAQMPSQESGFLRLGMPVKIKFDAYPFQDYGIVEGKLTQIAPDSTIEETPQGKIEFFAVEITLNQSYIQDRNKRIALTAGQTATAEVIVRQRRVIDFILDPFKKLQQGGLEL
jgi:HlyD family secretion protein